MNTNFQIPKSVIFAVAAAIGCFVAAIFAEPLFVKSTSIIIPQPPEPPSPFFCFCFDDSGSMDNNKRNAVKQAAKEFVNSRNLEKEKIGIVVFSSRSQVFLPLSHNKSEILSVIDSYSFGGGTVFAGALQDAMDQFQNDSEIAKLNQEYSEKCNEINEQITKVNNLIEQGRIKGNPINLLSPRSVSKIVLFFTDGENGDTSQALQKAQELREKGIKIYAVATLDGNKNYLGQMTGDSSQVYMTSDTNIKDAFKQMEQKINADISNANDDFLDNVRKQNNSNKNDNEIEIIVGNSKIFQNIQAMIWSSFLCIGMAIFIVTCQNRMMHKSLMESAMIVKIIVGGTVGGMIAGFIGNAVFQFIPLVFIGRLIGLGLLGGILALGMSFYIANLDRKWALLGGGIGGVLGSIGFLIFSFIGDTSGRLIGAAILGACIGAMIGLVETIYRNVWLMVVYDPRNFAQVNLGSQNVTVGSGKSDTVLIPNAIAKAGTFRAEGDKIRYTDSDGKQQLLVPGNHLKIGTVELVICSKDVPFSPSKFYPMKMSKARELQQQSQQ
ncbi:MAG: VWA domain-containing protein [Planctomycetaceae bacterium]|jgi:Ca-activated chloride channel family protein|nr:VWA domain-containing protein [Planctomycetaceae bacterium]